MRLFLSRFPARQLPGALLLFALLCVAMASPKYFRSDAATLIVTSTADSGAGSLRAAITAAADGDTIQFDATLNGQTITLTSGELVIDKSITISGPGATLLAVSKDSNPATRFGIVHVMPDHTVIIERLTISGGRNQAAGGGIFNDQSTLTINDCAVVTNYSAFLGGGIASSGASARLTIVDSAVNGNLGPESGGYGGGIYANGTLEIRHSTVSGNRIGFNLPPHFGATGGGIYSNGTLAISDSTVSGNFAIRDGGGIVNYTGTMTITDSTVSSNTVMGYYGGGIENVGSLTITNCTISGNTVSYKQSGVGGGIANGGPLTITNSTVSGNNADGSGGGIYNFTDLGGGGATIEIGNSILNAGLGANIVSGSGRVISRGYNVSSDDGGGFLTATGDQINTDPMLGPLQNNGGPTFTHDLLAGSPAVDGGDPNFTPPPLYDQRGFGYARVFNGRIDIGSLEVQPAFTPSPTPTATSTATATATATASATATATPTVTSTPTATTTPSPTATPSPHPAQALNISTRLRVETGERVMIGGFIITGSESKKVAMRGIGPSFGTEIDYLIDPTLELRGANGSLLFQNDNWRDDPAQAAQLTALGLALSNTHESGLVTTLTPNASYTAIMAGKNGGTGVGLVEIYDVDQAAASELANISTRGFVQPGQNVMIGGFILGGSSNNAGIAIRGIGPSLAQFGLSNVLADPTLQLYGSNGAVLITNDNWQDDPAAAAQLTAHGLAPQNPLESGIFAILPPGAFTAILAGKNGGTGIGLVEIYNVH